MQNFLLNLFQNIKSRLCERRNNRNYVNRFAVVERTDILVRKRQEPPQSIDLSSDLNQISLSDKIEPGPKQQQPKSQKPSQILQPIQHKPSVYKVNLQALKSDQETQAQNPRERLINSQMQISIYQKQVQQVYKKFKFLQEEDNRRKKHFWRHIYQNYTDRQLDKDISELIGEDESQNADYDIQTLQTSYQVDVVQIREIKYNSQLVDYPDIPFQTYKNVRELWAYGKTNPNHVIKVMKLKFLEKLLARSFRTLSFGRWLNDEMINGYLQMIDNKALELGKNYRVLNSFFAQNTFSKSTEVISRVLRRKNITNQNTIIIAINNGEHWIFAKIYRSKIIVYDSIRKNVEYYRYSSSTKTIFDNIIVFSDWFYGTKHEIVVEQNYPKQENSYDCGMFLLCGIKDIVRDYDDWSFCQYDINYKRIQVAQDFLNETISGFDS